MEEIFKDVSGFEKFYEVSNFGYVKSKKCVRKNNVQKRKFKSRILSFNKVRNKYPKIILYGDNGQKKEVRLHILIAEHFLDEKPFDNYQINHKDGWKPNCCVDNLEWISIGQNLQHSYDTGLRRKILTIDQIKEMKKMLKDCDGVYGSYSKIARKFDVSLSYINSIRKGKFYAKI